MLIMRVQWSALVLKFNIIHVYTSIKTYLSIIIISTKDFVHEKITNNS